MKSILSIIVFTLTFGFSVLLIGLVFGFPEKESVAEVFEIRSSHTRCLNQSQRNIESLLRRDINKGDERSSEIREIFNQRRATTYQTNISDYSQYIREYVDYSENLDDSRVPADFQKKWRAHMKAWRTYSDFLHKTAISSEKMSETTFAQLEDDYNSEITRTWYDVLSNAEEYYPGIRRKLGQ